MQCNACAADQVCRPDTFICNTLKPRPTRRAILRRMHVFCASEEADFLVWFVSCPKSPGPPNESVTGLRHFILLLVRTAEMRNLYHRPLRQTFRDLILHQQTHRREMASCTALILCARQTVL